MNLEITKIYPAPLTAMVKKLLLMDSAIYLNLTKDTIFSNSYLPTKDVAKIVTVETGDIFEFQTELKDNVKISFFAGQKLIDCLKYFDIHNLKGTLHCYDEEGESVAEKLIIRDGILEITLHCADVSLGFTTMSEQQVTAAFGKDNEIYSFDLSQENLTKLNNLITLDKNELFKIYSDQRGIHVAGDTYDIIIDDTQTDTHEEVNLFKSFFSRIAKETYRVSVCQNKLVLDSEDSNTNIALNLAIKA
tara:strand:- start:436 stop:1176 length:741 start_codon:yes stop_codon:yes gene_type:complete